MTLATALTIEQAGIAGTLIVALLGVVSYRSNRKLTQVTTIGAEVETLTKLLAELRTQLVEAERTRAEDREKIDELRGKIESLEARLSREVVTTLLDTNRMVRSILGHGSDASVAEFTALLHSITAVVIQADETGHIVLASDGIEKLLGYTPAELIGTRVSEIVPERLRERHLAAFARARATGKGTIVNSGEAVRLEALRKDGSEVPIWLALGLHEAPDGTKTFAATLTHA